MNQNFGFMEKLIPKIISGEKYVTNRPYSKSRKKCRIGDTMHIFKKFRTKEVKKTCDAKVIDRFIWKINNAPKTLKSAIRRPLLDIKGRKIQLKNNHNPNWFDFCVADGLVNYQDFYDYFSNHPKKAQVFFCYVFEKIDLSKIYHSILEWLEVRNQT